MNNLTMENNMDKETLYEINILKASIKSYEQQLKKPPFKFIFGEEDSHDIAKRIIARDKKELKKILYENGE
jgi:hypothetical protein